MPSPHSSSRLAQSAALHRSHCSFFGTLLLHERFNDVPLFLSRIPAGIHSKESGLIRRIPANRVIRSYSSILFLGTEYQWPALVGVEIGEIGSLLHDISFHSAKTPMIMLHWTGKAVANRIQEWLAKEGIHSSNGLWKQFHHQRNYWKRISWMPNENNNQLQRTHPCLGCCFWTPISDRTKFSTE